MPLKNEQNAAQAMELLKEASLLLLASDLHEFEKMELSSRIEEFLTRMGEWSPPENG